MCAVTTERNALGVHWTSLPKWIHEYCVRRMQKILSCVIYAVACIRWDQRGAHTAIGECGGSMGQS